MHVSEWHQNATKATRHNNVVSSSLPESNNEKKTTFNLFAGGRCRATAIGMPLPLNAPIWSVRRRLYGVQ